MHIVEARSTPGDPEAPGLHILGSEIATKEFAVWVIVGAVGTSSCGVEMGPEYADLLRGIKSFPPTVPQRMAELVCTILTSGNLERGFNAADANQYAELPQITWVTADGLYGHTERGRVVPDTYDLEEIDEASNTTSDVLALAGEVGADTFAYQAELMWSNDGTPSFRSDRYHMQLGSLSEVGEFDPLVTVIDMTHPSRERLV